MNYLAYILNIPWTLVGVATAIASFPKRVQIKQGVIIFNVQSFWWLNIFPHARQGKPRGCTNGHVILLGPKLHPNDLQHELIHVRQHMQYPFIFPFLYYYELAKNGYKNNRFEVEAYKEAGNYIKI